MTLNLSGEWVETAGMYLFDTDVITNVLKPRPAANLVKRLGSIPHKDQYISSITISEIVYGAVKSHRPEYHLRNLEEILLPSVNIVVFDTKAAYICGRLRAKLEKKGQSLPLADLEIASISIANNFTLITGNSRHFARIDGLNTENWLTQQTQQTQ
jgi:tRNA(fMet)-specific endonuclease VapC